MNGVGLKCAVLVLVMQVFVMEIAKAYDECGEFEMKTTNIAFYVQTRIMKPNETVRVVASADGDYETTTKWGTIGVGDILLTAEQSNTSKAVGRLKSAVIIADSFFTDYPHALQILEAVIETELYHGTFSLRGRDVASGLSELAVVGGTGDFWGVKGWANLTHVEYNLPDSVTFVNATLVHPPSLSSSVDLASCNQDLSS